MAVGVTSFRSTDIQESVDKTVACAWSMTFIEDGFDLFNLCEFCLTKYVDILFQFHLNLVLSCMQTTREIAATGKVLWNTAGRQYQE